MTLIEAVQSFHSATMAKPLSSAASSLYFTIIRVWNAARRPSSITMSSAELRRLSGIRCYDTYHDALETLLRRRFIKKIHPSTGLTLTLAVTNPEVTQPKAQNAKANGCINSPITETECVREVQIKPPDNTPSKYAGMSLAEMMQKRRAERAGL